MNLKIAAVGLLIAAATSARAGLIANWQFNNYTTGGALSGFKPDDGTQASPATLVTSTSGDFPLITGTTLNQTAASSSPNHAFEFKTATGNPPQSTLTFQISGLGNKNYIISYASRADGSYNQQWSYSLNGTTFVPVGAAKVAGSGVSPASWTTTALSIDFSAETALNAASAANAPVYFRDTITFTGNNQTVDVDNVSISAVPEPTNIALSLFGIGAIGMAAGRRLFSRKSVPTA